MTQDKELLLKDLCARLPYGVKARVYNHWSDDVQDETITIENLHQLIKTFSIKDIKPYLFPLSSMTDEQKSQYSFFLTRIIDGYDSSLLIDWLNKNHFDYRGLIPKGLAIDATNKTFIK